MRDEYNIEALNPRKNPYSGRLKKQITMNIDSATIDYFKSLAESEGIPHETLSARLRHPSAKDPSVLPVRSFSRSRQSFPLDLRMIPYYTHVRFHT